MFWAGLRLIYPNQKHDSKSWFQNHKHDPATLHTLCFNAVIQGMYLICFETWTEYGLLVSESYFWFAQIKRCNTPSPTSWMINSLKIINWLWSTQFEILFPICSNKTVNQNHDFESWFIPIQVNQMHPWRALMYMYFISQMRYRMRYATRLKHKISYFSLLVEKDMLVASRFLGTK